MSMAVVAERLKSGCACVRTLMPTCFCPSRMCLAPCSTKSRTMCAAPMIRNSTASLTKSRPSARTSWLVAFQAREWGLMGRPWDVLAPMPLSPSTTRQSPACVQYNSGAPRYCACGLMHRGASRAFALLCSCRMERCSCSPQRTVYGRHRIVIAALADTTKIAGNCLRHAALNDDHAARSTCYTVHMLAWHRQSNTCCRCAQGSGGPQEGAGLHVQRPAAPRRNASHQAQDAAGGLRRRGRAPRARPRLVR